MSIVLNPGSSGYIYVEDQEYTEVFRKKISSAQEAKDFMDTYGISKPGYSILKACFIPTRTDNIRDFLKDLFLPTFVNRALKVQFLTERIFVSIAAIALDSVTFIPRLFLSPLKAIYDYKNNTEHPLATLIKNHPAAAQAMRNGILKIHVHFKDVKINNDRVLFGTAKEDEIIGTVPVAIKHLPRYEESSNNYLYIRTTYRDKSSRKEDREKGEKWAIKGSSRVSSQHFPSLELNCVRIGYGCVAPIHEQKLAPLGVKTVGVIDNSPAKKTKIVADGFFSCETYEEAAKLKPHFWDVCTPTDQRLAVIKNILRVDPKACILLEKPVCPIEQIAEFEALEKSGATFVVNENYLSSQIAEEVKKKAFEELKLKPKRIIIEFDKNRTQDFKKGRYIDPRGALNYEGTHMITCLQSLGSEFLPKGNISKKYEDIFIPEQLKHQGCADIAYEVNGVAVHLFSSMKGDVKHSFPPYGVTSIPESDTATRYRILAVEGIDPKGNPATVVGFYEPIKGFNRSEGAIAVIRDGKVVELQAPIQDDSMGNHLARVVDYFKFKQKGQNPCPIKEGIQAITMLDPMLM
jgi:hypothetical protein